jgi:hypothetical protein
LPSDQTHSEFTRQISELTIDVTSSVIRMDPKPG